MRAAAPLIVAFLVALAGCVQEPEESVEESPDPVTPVPTSGEDASAPSEPDAGSASAGNDTANADDGSPDPAPTDDDSATAPDEPASNGTPAPSADENETAEDEPDVIVKAPADGNEPAGSSGNTTGDEPAPASDGNDTAEAGAEDGNTTDAWPRNGSYARYHVHQGAGSPGGMPWTEWDVDVLVTFVDGNWTARCTGTATHAEHNGTWTEAVNRTAALAPPRAPTNVSEGENVTVPGFNARCEPTTHPVTVVDANASYATNQSGEPVNVSAIHGYRDDPCKCQGDEAYWDDERGLVLEWWFGGRAGGWTGKLLDTDAPLA